MEDDPNRDLAQMSLAEFSHERGVHADEAAKFDRIFYILRAHFRDTEPELWVSWQRPYPEMMRVLQEWEDKFLGVALATTKDTGSAQKLLASVGRSWPVFGKEFSEHKADQLYGIGQHFRVDPTHILFLDDLLENLEQVRPTKAQTALADWGYNLEESRAQALHQGHRVVSLDELPGLLGQFLSQGS